jgi:integrase
MAWIKWRRNRAGIRMADLRWYGPDGRERSLSLGTSDPVLARQALKRHVEASDGHRAAMDPSGPAGRALEAFYAAVAEERAEATVSFYRKQLGSVSAQMPPTLRVWTPAAFRRAAAHVHGRVRTASPRLVQMRVNAARRFVAWARRAGYVVPDFVGDFRGRATVRRVPRALSLDDRAALLAAVRGLPLEPMVALACLAGMRPSEYRAAQWRDVRWRAREVVVRGTKRHRERVVPAGDALLDVLTRHRQPSGGIVGEPGDVRARLRTLGRRIGLDWTRTPYTLRHTYATGLVQTGADVPTIAALMGHASPSTTLTYLHSDPARLRAAVDRGT